MIRVARACSKAVSMTVPWRPSSIPWAISSRPGASGIDPPMCGFGVIGRDRQRRPLDRLGGRLARLEPRPLLCADRVVALTPAEVGLAADEPLQFVEAGQ